MNFPNSGQFQKGEHCSPSTEFKKGHIPWCKGMKGLYSGSDNPFYGKKHSKESKRTLREALKGKSNSPKTEFQKGQSPWNKGKKQLNISKEKHWNWQGGITKLNHKIRTSLEYKKWRKNIFTRDDFTCQICGRRGGELRANHIKKFVDYPELRFVKNNGITICRDCDIRWVLYHEKEWESYFLFNLLTRQISQYSD